jgi:uncharacterized protein YgfB (UPF0149 family)
VTAGPSSTTLDYDALRELLAHAGAVVALAELHGGICGALCAGAGSAAQRWLADCFADQQVMPSEPMQDVLDDLMGSSWQMLEGGDLKFEPLLPDEDALLEEQVQAVALWCHGFLSGLGGSAPDVGNRLEAAHRAEGGTEPAVIDEVLSDFAQISRAGLSAEDAADENQTDFALAEIKEYVRVSVQLVFEDLAPRRAAVAREVH